MAEQEEPKLVITPTIEGGQVVLELSHFTRRIGFSPESWEQLTRAVTELATSVDDGSTAEQEVE